MERYVKQEADPRLILACIVAMGTNMGLWKMAEVPGKIYVLDQNYLRSDELKALVVDEPHAKFVLPDIALLEMCKGNKWRETMERSLKTLARTPGRVMQSMSVGEAINFELANATSIEGQLLPKDFTRFVRSILRDVAANRSGPGVSLISKSIDQAHKDIRKEELDHRRNQLSLTTRTDIIKSALGNEQLRQLKNGTVPHELRLGIIHSVSHDLIRTFLASEGYSPNRIKSFLKTKPLMLRFFLLSVRHAFEWARKGGLESFPAEKITNDIVDQEYVAIASFFDGIKTMETRVNEADHDLRKLLRM